MHLWLREDGDGVVFRVQVQPRAAKNRIQGLHGETLKLSLTAPPVEGAANRLCREFLAQELKVPKNRVNVVGGYKSRRKTIRVENLSGSELCSRLKIEKFE
jgi:uncharacterized protein (TIGR00251 family)